MSEEDTKTDEKMEETQVQDAAPEEEDAPADLVDALLEEHGSSMVTVLLSFTVPALDHLATVVTADERRLELLAPYNMCDAPIEFGPQGPSSPNFHPAGHVVPNCLLTRSPVEGMLRLVYRPWLVSGLMVEGPTEGPVLSLDVFPEAVQGVLSVRVATRDEEHQYWQAQKGEILKEARVAMEREALSRGGSSLVGM